MANPATSENYRVITFPARDGLLHAITRRAEVMTLSHAKAAVSLIEEAIAPPPAAATALVNLEAVSTDDLIDELVGRLQRVAELEAALERAAAAEARLAQVATAMSGTIKGAAHE